MRDAESKFQLKVQGATADDGVLKSLFEFEFMFILQRKRSYNHLTMTQ